MRATWNALRATTIVAVLVALAGCGAEDPRGMGTGGEVTSAEYVAAAEELLGPSHALARIVSDRMAGRDARPAARPDELLAGAESELREFQALPLGDALLRAQRARVVNAFRPVLARMRVVVEDLSANDREALERSGPAYFSVLKDLPSASS
jgi:hypothetical protein